MLTLRSGLPAASGGAVFMTFLRGSALVLCMLTCASFLRAQSNVKTINVTFTTIDVPGAVETGIAGINTAGEMVGFYANSVGGSLHSFSLSSGVFSFFDYPGAVSTEATGINDSGLIVGFDGDFFDNGFLYDGTTFTDVVDGQNTRTFVLGIDNAGDMAGGAGTPYTTKAFVRHGARFVPIKFPGTYSYAYTTGINNLGQVVGWADSDSYLYAHGKFKIIDFPGANLTAAFSINDNGIVVGYYQMNAIVIGFALKNGKFLSFSYPNAVETFVYGVNKVEQIVGTYSTDYQTFHGFVTNPITSADFQ